MAQHLRQVCSDNSRAAGAVALVEWGKAAARCSKTRGLSTPTHATYPAGCRRTGRPEMQTRS